MILDIVMKTQDIHRHLLRRSASDSDVAELDEALATLKALHGEAKIDEIISEMFERGVRLPFASAVRKNIEGVLLAVAAAEREAAEAAQHCALCGGYNAGAGMAHYAGCPDGKRDWLW